MKKKHVLWKNMVTMMTMIYYYKILKCKKNNKKKKYMVTFYNNWTRLSNVNCIELMHAFKRPVRRQLINVVVMLVKIQTRLCLLSVLNNEVSLKILINWNIKKAWILYLVKNVSMLIKRLIIRINWLADVCKADGKRFVLWKRNWVYQHRKSDHHLTLHIMIPQEIDIEFKFMNKQFIETIK